MARAYEFEEDSDIIDGEKSQRAVDYFKALSSQNKPGILARHILRVPAKPDYRKAVKTFIKKFGGPNGRESKSKDQIVRIIWDMGLAIKAKETEELIELLQGQSLICGTLPSPSSLPSGVYEVFKLEPTPEGNYRLKFGKRFDPDEIKVS